MAEHRDHHLSAKLKETLALTALLAALHWAVWITSCSVTPLGIRFVLVTIGDFDIGLNPLLNRGAAWGAIQQAGVYGRVSVFVVAAVGLFALLSVLPIISGKYRIQLVLIELLCASIFAENLEKLIEGYARQYLDLGFGRYRFPVFSLYELVITSTLASLYLLVFLKFFRLLPSFKHVRREGEIVDRIRDPLWENRKTLRAILTLLAALAAIRVSADGVVAFVEARKMVGAGGVLAMTSTTVLLSGAVSFGPLILCWHLIPARHVDVIYLRSFRTDMQSWKTAHHLRRALRGQLRLSGVVDPEESRRWYYLAYWLVNPFMFAVGDMHRINATRHTMFLEGDWKEGIRTAFSNARAAVFDCRTLTENLLWEIGTGLRIHGPERTIFVIPDATSPTHLRTSLVASGIRESDLVQIPAENYAHESGTTALANRLKVLLAAKEV